MIIRNRPRLSRHQKAFTLIEMLVVMVIVSLLITVIMQGFGYSMGLYQRVVKSQKNAYNEVMAYGWLRSTLGAQVAARPKDIGLEGGANELSTFTYQPLVEHEGLKTRIQWQLAQDGDAVSLVYREGSTLLAVYRWPESSAQFEYLDEKGNWHKRWPLEKADITPLPVSIRVHVSTGREVRNYVVSVATRKRADVTMDEMLYGR